MDFKNSIQEWASSLKDATAEELKVSYLFGSSHKIELSNQNKKQYLSTVLYLMQENLSGFNMCPWATDSCREICLGTKSGHAAMIGAEDKTNTVQVARLKRTIMFKKHRDTFIELVRKELRALMTKAKKKNVEPVCRFNGSSDIPFEALGICEEFPEIMFYDYTKGKARMIKFLAGQLPKNYHLTFSYAPENEADSIEILALGGNVAAVFNEKKSKKHSPSFLGKYFLGHEIISGDEHDLRFTDPTGGYVVGLTKKGIKNSDARFFVKLEKVFSRLAA